MLRTLAVGVLLLASAVRASERTASVVREPSGKFTVVEGRAANEVAWAVYDQAINSTGWAFLELHSNPDYEDSVQAYGAGYLEGELTAPLIRDMYLNMVEGVCTKMGQDVCEKIQKFVAENIDWMNTMMVKNQDDAYWHQVGLVFAQLQGMIEGYGNSTETTKIGFAEFLYIGINFDLDAITSAIAPKSKAAARRVLGSGSCSAMVKVLQNFSDILFAHDTWSELQTMLRIYKYYDLPFTTSGKGSKRVPGARIGFSSYPMSLFSGDDFYTIGTGLAVMETTNGNYNKDLWKYIQPTGTVLNYFRCIVANRLATTGEEWTSLYIKFNSGTYNNQWMVFDYNRFQQFYRPEPGAFYVLEQLPGNYEVKDMTYTLIEKGYWASYNIPYFPRIYELSGLPAYKAKYGNFFSYSEAPRALIFDRNHSHAVDMKTMMDVMRYNNFKHDPLGRCDCNPPYSGENGLAARSDLNPANGTYPIPSLGHRMHGATDAKITSSSMIRELSALIISGPTARQLPIFRWSTSGVAKPHGHPDEFDFSPVEARWKEV